MFPAHHRPFSHRPPQAPPQTWLSGTAVASLSVPPTVPMSPPTETGAGLQPVTPRTVCNTWQDESEFSTSDPTWWHQPAAVVSGFHSCVLCLGLIFETCQWKAELELTTWTHAATEMPSPTFLPPSLSPTFSCPPPSGRSSSRFLAACCVALARCPESPFPHRVAGTITSTLHCG